MLRYQKNGIVGAGKDGLRDLEIGQARLGIVCIGMFGSSDAVRMNFTFKSARLKAWPFCDIEVRAEVETGSCRRDRLFAHLCLWEVGLSLLCEEDEHIERETSASYTAQGMVCSRNTFWGPR